MTTSVDIRPLAPEDLPSLAPLVAESEADGFRFLRRWSEEPMPLSENPADESTAYYGAFVAGRIVGVGGVTPDPYALGSDVGRLRHIYVASDVRRRGIGARLVRALESFATRTYTTLRLRTDAAVAAAFYVSLGYGPVQDPNATHVRRLVPLESSRE